MKKLLFTIATVLFAASAFAQADRDVLVAPNGTIYTIEASPVENSTKIKATIMLVLTTQSGDTITRIPVPASTTEGLHWRATLAYDTESQTLFVLWLHMPNPMSSELLLAAYQNGHWQPAVSIDDRSYDLRYNLRIGITRRVSRLQQDGSYADVPALILHAVWWDDTGAGEQARYALISIDKGAVSSVDVHDMAEFIDATDAPAKVGDDFNRDLLKHPAVLDGPSPNSVDVLFADSKTNLFHRVTLHPISEARIHIPVGHHGTPAVPGFSAPESFSAPWNGSVTTLVSPHDRDKVLFCSTTESGVTYLVHSDAGWSDAKTLTTSATLTSDAAIAALVKMISTE